jgi:Common central domain of tyrosinase/Polyphenol oxidase middle domain
MSLPSNKPFAETSRRSVVKGGAALLGASVLGLAAGTGSAQVTRTRMDIVSFAQDSNRLAKFAAAMGEMQARSAKDPNDPQGWLANANMHRDFCSTPGASDPAQIHFCWWFLAWHRAYISVTERKIRAISGDDSFCYPYWNWSSDRRIPAPYAKQGSPLANAIRFPRATGLSDDEVGYLHDDPDIERLGVAALSATSFEAKTADDIPFSFGGIARPNPENQYDNNALESTPHGPVHNFAGGQKRSGGQTIGGDMTDFETAARDPIFFAHHGNLDRLWETWRQDPARKSTEPTSDAFLQHSFVFQWLDGTPIQVAMSDLLDTTKLGYTYDYLDVFRPNGPQVMAEQAVPERLAPIATQKLNVPLAAQGVDDGSRKYLEITGVANPNAPLTVTVYLKAANAPASDPGIAVGTFAAVSNGGKIDWPSGRLVFDITNAAKRFGGQELTVELVPHRIGSDADQQFAPLKYEQMQIITRRP